VSGLACSPTSGKTRTAWRALSTRTLGTVVCAWVLGLSAIPVLAADAGTALERTVKAAYLYKCLSYVDWPSGTLPPGAPLVIGIAGADAILTEMHKIVPERTVAERPLEVRPIRDGDSLAGVHALFVGRAEAARLPEYARAARQHSILLLSEVEDGLRLGSIINLIIVDGRVRFEVALDAAERSGLKLSSRLLALAQTVRPAVR